MIRSFETESFQQSDYFRFFAVHLVARNVFAAHIDIAIVIHIVVGIYFPANGAVFDEPDSFDSVGFVVHFQNKHPSFRGDFFRYWNRTGIHTLGFHSMTTLFVALPRRVIESRRGDGMYQCLFVFAESREVF